MERGDASTTWRVWHDSLAKDVQILVKEQLAKPSPPLLVYRDPSNGPQRIAGFVGLSTPDRLGRDVPLTEARLFYPDGLLHLVADGNATRWAVWCEGDAAPSWYEVSGAGRSPRLPATVRAQRVLLRQRPGGGDVCTGLGEADVSGKQIGARLYYEDGVLQWWRLTCDG